VIKLTLQDEYTLFPSKYAVGVHGYMLVYSITSRQSFEMVQTVHDKILDFAGLERVPCVIVAQKVDLQGDR
jgi:Ras family protein